MEHLFTLGMLILLQGVLGFDNLLYIALESERAPEDRRQMVRRVGIGLAIVLRIVLLFTLMRVIVYFQDPIFDLHSAEFAFTPNIHSLIVLLGGAFLLYTATKEILHMMSLEEEHHATTDQKPTGTVIVSIVTMNVVFSFDSILSAMALSDVFWVMATAIIVGGVLMIWLADTVSTFLQKNRMYEVLGLFVLFVVGIMLITEGGHLAHIKLFGNEITPMSKTTFYFVIGILVLTDVVQGRYQRKLLRLKQSHAARSA